MFLSLLAALNLLVETNPKLHIGLCIDGFSLVQRPFNVQNYLVLCHLVGYICACSLL